jgi:hypothetical protein
MCPILASFARVGGNAAYALRLVMPATLECSPSLTRMPAPLDNTSNTDATVEERRFSAA